jgi:hypothetical protein
MSAETNKAALRTIFDATARGDGRPFVSALADDVRWTIIGSTAWSRTYAGKQAVLAELLGPLASQIDGANTIIAERMIAEGDWVAVEGRGDNVTCKGVPYRNRYCWVIRMADGKMAEITEYADTQLIAEALDTPVIPPQD